MTIVTSDEIAQSVCALADYPEALAALQIIKECGGNLEDAAEAIVIEAGAEGTARGDGFGKGAEFIERLAQKCHRIICQDDFRSAFVDGFSANVLKLLVPVVMTALAASSPLPVALAVAVVMYLLKRGIKRFCQDSEGFFSNSRP
jgi:hypothetical protein